MLNPPYKCGPKYFLSFCYAKSQEEREHAARRAHDRAGDGDLHLDLRWPGSHLTSCAGFIRETLTSSPLESQALACRAKQEQRLCCWLIETCLAASPVDSGRLVPFGEPGTPTLSPWPLSPAVTTAAGHAETQA